MDRGLVSNYAEQIRGVSYKPNDLHEGLDKDSVILLRANNIDDGKINFDDVVYVDRKKVSKSQYLQKGDILICASSGSKNLVGKAAFIDFDNECAFGAFCKVVRPTKVTPEFLGVFFQSPSYRRKISALAQGANINNIKNEHIDNLQLAIYSEREQRQIIARLTRVITIIHARKDELSKLDELIKARFVEMFGDIANNSMNLKETRVADCCKMTQGTQIPMADQISEYQEGYYRYLYIRDLKYDNDDWIFVRDQYDEKKLTERDLVVVNTGNTAGEIYKGKDGILSNNLFKVSFDSELLLPTYLFYYFRSEAFQNMLWSEMKEGTQPHLGHKIFGSKKLLVPQIGVQEQFDIFVKQVDKSKVA